MFTLSTGKERRKISLSRSLFSLKVNLSHYFGYEGLVLRTLLGGFHRAVREGAGVGGGGAIQDPQRSSAIEFEVEAPEF